MQSEHDEHKPSWLSEDYDEKHREETVPMLFGEGKLDLQDPEQPAGPSEPQSSLSLKEYGSLNDRKLPGESTEPEVPFRDAQDKKDTDDTKSKSPSTPTNSKKGKEPSNMKKKEMTPRSAAALRAKPHVPSQNPCLWLFHFLQGIGVIASLMLWTTQIIPVVLARKSHGTGILAEIGIASVALKAYISAFCLVFIAVESDLPIPFVLNSNLLQRYFSRGFLYSFLGLICLEEAYSERVRDIVHKGGGTSNLDVGWAAIFMQLSSWLMLAVGVVYMLLGMCCMKRVRDRMKEREKEDWQEYREAMKDWKDLYQ